MSLNKVAPKLVKTLFTVPQQYLRKRLNVLINYVNNKFLCLDCIVCYSAVNVDGTTSCTNFNYTIKA